MAEPTKEELAKMHWRDRYEYEAGRAYQTTMKPSERELISRIEHNRIGPYFVIWRAIAEKGTVTNAAMPMWRYLERSPGDSNELNRFHCAAALFQILGMPDPDCKNELRKQVQWDHQGEEARQEALLRLRVIIEDLQQSSA